MASVQELVLRMQTLGAKAASAEVEAVKGSVSGLGRAAMLMAGAFGIGAAIDSFAKFQKQQTMLMTQTGATRQEMERTTKGILSMAVSVGTGPQSLSEALYHIESAGYRGSKALDVLRTAAEGAKIGNANLVDVTNALTAAVVSGIGGARDMNAAMGMLNATVGAGDMTMQDLADAMSTGILASGKAMGLRLKDLSAALAVLGDNNIRGSEAATRLRMGLMQLIHVSDPAAKSLKALGLGPNALAEDLRKPNGLLTMLQHLKHQLDVTFPNDPTRQTAALAGIFGGGRNSAAILILMQQLDRLKSKYDAVANGAHNFGSAWDQTKGTWQFIIDQAKTLGEVVLIHLGKAIADIITWFQKHKTAALVLRDAVIALTAAWVAYKVAMVTAAIVTAVAGGFEALAGAVSFAVAAVYLLTGAMGALDAAIAATGIGALIIALGLGLYMLITHFKEVKAAAIDAWHWIKTAAMDTWDWIKGHWQLLTAIILAPILAPITAVVWLFRHVLLGTIEDVINWISHHWRQLILILGPFGLAIDFITKHFNIFKTVAVGVIDFIIARFRNLISVATSIGSIVVGVFKWLYGALKGPVNLIWTVATWPFREMIRIAGTVWNGIKGPLGAIPGLLHDIANGIWNILTWPFREAIKFAEKLWSLIQTILGPLGKIGHAGGGLIHGLIHGGASIVSDVAGFFGVGTHGQTGGLVTGGGMFEVGEKGRERVFLPGGSLIVPHQFSNTALEAGGGQVLDNTIVLEIDGIPFARAIKRSLATYKSNQ